MIIKKTLSLIFLLLIICTPVAADIVIGPLIINENSTPADVISFVFQLLVAVGALIAVAMVIVAGVEWMTSDGNPGKIDGAKTKIKNALLGVVILLGSYLILNTINPELPKPEITELKCNTGIIVTADDGDPATPDLPTQRCIDGNMDKIDYNILTTENNAGWDFPIDLYLKVYAFSEENYKGGMTTFDFSYGLGDPPVAPSGVLPPGTKSIFFLKRNQGIYLYDDIGYEVKNKFPLNLSSSVSDLTMLNFNNISRSIDFIDTSDVSYSAVLFTGENYSGRCAYVSLKQPNLKDGGTISLNYTDRLGNDTISSIIVNKMLSGGPSRGQVIFYTAKNCSAPGPLSGSEIKECRVDIPGGPVVGSFVGPYCPDFDAGDNIMSFVIDGSASVVLSTVPIGGDGHGHFTLGDDNTRCQYWNERGTCIDITTTLGLYVGTPVYSIVGGNKPKGFIIIPNN